MSPEFWSRLGGECGLLLLAWVLGGLVGWQREAHGRSAGLRTHMLVCGGSCLVTLVSFGGMGDPGRIAAQVITGIGFLGAGVILRRGLSVRGLTTAASIWVVAGIGVATGAGGRFAILATVATLLCLATLTLAQYLEDAIQENPATRILAVTYPATDSDALQIILRAITEAGAFIVGYDASEPEEDDDREQTAHHRWKRLSLQLRLRQDIRRNALLHALATALPEARFTWQKEDAAFIPDADG